MIGPTLALWVHFQYQRLALKQGRLKPASYVIMNVLATEKGNLGGRCYVYSPEHGIGFDHKVHMSCGHVIGRYP